ncbi:MAG: PP2C family protein-serine/threonine phosphatase [Planctomycetota bacterium]
MDAGREQDGPLTAGRREGGASALLRFHSGRAGMDIDEALAEEMGNLVGDVCWALLLDEGEWMRVHAAGGIGCPLEVGESIVELPRTDGPCMVVPLVWQGTTLGEIRVEVEPNPMLLAEVGELAAHYSGALVEGALGSDLDRETRSRGQLLQAFEETAKLLQETEREANQARFLEICTDVLGCSAAALYVHERPGDPRSPLQLAQCWGIGEGPLESLGIRTGGPWDEVIEHGRTLVLSRDRLLTIVPGHASEALRQALQGVVLGPLRYGKHAIGVVLLLDSNPEGGMLVEDRPVLEGLLRFGAVAVHRRDLEDQALRGRLLQKELDLAAELQERLLPQGTVRPELVDWGWHVSAANRIGGDWLDLVESPGGAVSGVVADVSGSGLQSALMMTSFRASWLEHVQLHEPGALLARLNDKVCQESEGTGMFVTAAAYSLSPSGRSLGFANAGHPSALLFLRRENRILHLGASGPPLGFQKGARYTTRHYEVTPGDVLLAVTDGLLEAAIPGTDSRFGDHRLETVFRACLERDAAFQAPRSWRSSRTAAAG